MNSPLTRVVAAQICATADPEHNLALVTEHTRRAAQTGARLVLFPEATMACFGTDLAAVAEDLDGAFATGVRRAAAQAGITVAVGMFTPADDGRVHNTLFLTGPDGECRYDKIHLYDAFGSRESDLVAPGTELVVADVAGLRVGLATCYDIRFADHFTALGRAGAELVLVAASWGEGPGKAEQWDLLTRARAMDAQAYLLACDMAWRPPEGPTPLGVGRSVLVDPSGEVRARLGAQEGLLQGEVDRGSVSKLRERVPIL